MRSLLKLISIVMMSMLTGVIYFLVVTPLALVTRLTRGSRLQPVERDGGFWVSRRSNRSEQV